ncbi:hypothetical protein JCM11641_002367 [Rhodosporidiobolus odoratus]
MGYPPPVEPDSPTMYEEEEPELDGLRHLSVSTDGTIESLISLDENPTPPQSPSPSHNPVVHISPPGASFPLGGPRVLDFGDEDFPMSHAEDKGKRYESTPQAPIVFAQDTFFAPPLASPDEQPSVLGNLATRRTATGKLPPKALLSLQQMRFESSREAGMGLGVGPPSSGLEGLSPGGPGFTFRAAMGLDAEEKDGRRSPLLSPGVENIYLASPSSLGPPAHLKWPAQKRNPNLRLNIAAANYSPSSSPLHSSSDRAPPSPHIKRSSAFHISNTGPRTPLTPSHLPGAPILGGGGAAFTWSSYSFPDSPGCPVPPPGSQVAERTCYFDDIGVSSPTSSNGTYFPTPSSERSRTPMGMNRHPMPASPLAQGVFSTPSAPAESFFA